MSSLKQQLAQTYKDKMCVRGVVFKPYRKKRKVQKNEMKFKLDIHLVLKRKCSFDNCDNIQYSM